MRTRLAGFALAAAMAGFVGCGTSTPDKKIALQIDPTLAQPRPEQGALPDTKTGSAPAKNNSGATSISQPMPADPAGALAKKTESYAKSMQTALEHRTAAKSPSSQESLVQWIDPSEFRIGSNDDDGNHAALQQTAPAAPSRLTLDKDGKPPIQIASAQANRDIPDSGIPVEGSNSPAAIPEPSVDKASAMLPGAVDPVETRITKRAKDFPRDVSANLDYQLMLFLRDESVPQLSSLTALPGEDRELIAAVMDGLSNFRSTLRSDNNMLYSRKIRPLTDLADRLKQQAELSIPMLTLCTKVEGFGRYDPIQPANFPAARDNEAIIYCELENFASQLNADKMYQTDVTQEAILYKDDGMQVWADKTQTIQDLSRHRRHDFFLRTLVKFPATLTVGRYMLKVSIVDRQANRVAEASLPIQIVSQ